MNNLIWNIRHHVWLSAWCAVTGSSECIDDYVAAETADRCLREFEERFNKETEDNNE